MTEQKSLKRRVRVRMSKTGERYTAARRQILLKADPLVVDGAPAPATIPFRGPHVSDDALRARTGRGWQEWFALLEAWGAAERSHPEIARWLNVEHGVDGWWAQEVTVGYEMASGRRVPGQAPDGLFAVSATKTVGVPVERLFQAFVDEELRARWLPGASLHLRTATAPRTARFDWEEGATRIVVGFTTKGAERSSVAIQHERLADAELAARMKAFWRERVVTLQRLLED